MVSYHYEDRLISLEHDRKQMQNRLENLQYAMTVIENQLNNYNHSTQNKVYYIVMGIVLEIVIFILFVKY